MFFTIPQANPFGGTASVSIDVQDLPLVGSLQWKIKAQAPFVNLNTVGAVDTVSTADSKIDSSLVATGSDT